MPVKDLNICFELFRNGDERTFKAVFDNMMPELRMVLPNKYRNIDENDLEDYISEAFYHLFVHRAIIKDYEQIRRVLYRFIKCRIIDYWRKIKYYAPTVMNFDDHDECYDEEHAIALASLQLETTIYYYLEPPAIEKYHELLIEAISKLPNRQREIVELTRLGYPCKKIAKILGLASQTVSNLRNRALKSIINMIPEATQKTGHLMLR